MSIIRDDDTPQWVAIVLLTIVITIVIHVLWEATR